GIFTHFAVADDPDSTFTQTQLERFLSATESLPGTEQTLIRHAANSAATILDTRTHLGMVRVGIALYGLHPSKATVGRAALSPALSLKAEVASVKHIGAGEGVSYGLTYRASGPTRIALVPAGYGDGYSRLLSNAAEVLIGGRRLTVSGTVCMDQFMVDVGNHPVAAGDEVVLIGKQGAEEITVDEIARHMGTINYEVTCLISQRVPRLYHGAGHGS
ncbi:MAG: alanine racemase, partial [Terriglobia bacterium]